MAIDDVHYSIVFKNVDRLAFEAFINLNYPDMGDISDLLDEAIRIYGKPKYWCITIYKAKNSIKNGISYDFLPAILDYFIKESTFAPMVHFNHPFCKFMHEILDT